MLSCVRLFEAPGTVAHQASLCMEFSKQEYWSGLPFPSQGDLPDPGIEPGFSALAGGFFTTSTTWEAQGGKLWFSANLLMRTTKFPSSNLKYATYSCLISLSNTWTSTVVLRAMETHVLIH